MKHTPRVVSDRETALKLFMDDWDGNMGDMPRQDAIYRRGWTDAARRIKEEIDANPSVPPALIVTTFARQLAEHERSGSGV